jgi:hypothetical protein
MAKELNLIGFYGAWFKAISEHKKLKNFSMGIFYS